jgi:large subunit ribosomal protein L13e
MKHNNALPTGHFRKHWQERVKTWFDQAGRKKRRRLNRIKKAAAIAPRPLDALRPAVRCPSIKYNSKLRPGRGFTLEELKAAKINPMQARTIGIAVDHRRRNRSVESLQLNVARLQTYLSKLVLFPKNPKAPKTGEASAEECAAASQNLVSLPIVNTVARESPRKVTDAEKKVEAFNTLKKAHLHARYWGIREKRAKIKAEEELAAAKK